jgi:hypothetical protein
MVQCTRCSIATIEVLTIYLSSALSFEGEECYTKAEVTTSLFLVFVHEVHLRQLVAFQKFS